MQYVMYAAKAIIAAALAGLGVLAGFLTNDTSLGDITAGQWITVAVAVLVSFSGVFAAQNGPAPVAKKK